MGGAKLNHATEDALGVQVVIREITARRFRENEGPFCEACQLRLTINFCAKILQIFNERAAVRNTFFLKPVKLAVDELNYFPLDEACSSLWPKNKNFQASSISTFYFCFFFYVSLCDFS